ncbi:citrate lyase acyl carrier protein [Klebsiella huaxiensis]|uniref:Citrate lyase acyl carrier protein n=1 Tax=Klebsiella huaxiensis TaxID=2153354 RepID=A0ABT6E8J6_9ENTR|nr:citrate lyase acyl carrier protein [Klebsiella huaxiensis]MDG1640680.1 citrate lyase acyl carrier protein [Klebsiella huaxiensis]QBG10728.1 citrate lyase acyl carrier protein [Klebsiella huaxiensis]
MKQIVPAVAGTLESSDVMIRIEPLTSEQPPEIEISSSVQKQFGDAIRATLDAVLQQHAIHGVAVIVDDKGALDCVLRARLETALMRAGALTQCWGEK